MQEREKMLDRIRGALYGVAVGDALGGPLEFMSADAIEEKYGRVTEMIGGGWLHLMPGETTDDTAMTMCVAEGILERPDMPYQAIGRRFIDWYKSGPKDIGNACASSIRTAMENGGDWWEAAHQTQAAQGRPVEGNGALMRTIYPALYYRDEKKRRLVTRGIALMTHAGKQSAYLCEEYVEDVHKAIMGTGIWWRLTPGSRPTGYVVDSYNNAIESITQTRTFEDAVVEAVNRGGDADTIGAICGGLAGAMYGYQKIPRRWIDCLNEDMKREMDRLAEAAMEKQEEPDA